MAVNINIDLAGNPEIPTIILANRNGNKLGQLKVNEDSVDLNDKFIDAPELSFTVNKYIDGEITPLWDKLVDFKLIYCKEWDLWFEISVELNEETESLKTVFGTQLAYAELSQVNLYNVEINTEKDIDRDDYKITILYDSEDSQASLVHRIFEKAPHYSIDYVDPTIRNIQRSFSFDDISIVDACQEVGEEMGCLFKFNSNTDKETGMPQRTVSIYDLYQNCYDCGYRGEFTDKCPECGKTNIEYGYGEDTTIYVTSDELASNGIEIVTDTGAVKNCFKLEAGDDLMTATIRNCNPNGTDYIWYFSDSIKEDMSDELVEKLESYDSLYANYYNDYVSELDVVLVGDYNNLVTKYSAYKKDLQGVNPSIAGYSSLMNAYYNTIDLEWYLKSGLMPNIEMSKTDAKEQASWLIASSISPVAVANASIVSEATANSVVLAMAKIIVNPTYKVQINDSEYNKSAKIWTGNFVVTNYSDEEDTAISPIISVRINDDLETFVKQKIDKALSKENTDDLSITGLFKKNTTEFKKELKRYALVPLTNFYDACQSCIDILIEQNIADDKNDLYDKLYSPYYEKLLAIESEIKVREDELSTIIGVYDINDELIEKGLQQEIEECRNEIQKVLNFQNYMGEDLWLEFCAYRREDKYSNGNYISDGLNNAELFSKALEFYKVAQNEIYKSAELQHSISATLNNLLIIEKFKPLVKFFNVGNWLRVRIDDNVYKLRLLEYNIDFGNLDTISVEFSDITKVRNGITDIESVFSKASSMASSYDALIKQSNKGEDARNIIREWLTEGLDTALVQIQNNVNEDIVIDQNGLLGRSYDDITGTYSPEQIKLTHNIIAYTDDNWESVRQAIGKHKYRIYDESKMGFVDKIGYGMGADFVTAGVVSGSQIIGGNIYSSNYEPGVKGSFIDLDNGWFDFGGGALKFGKDGKLTISSPDIPTTEQITEINEQYLKTTSVYAENLVINAAHIKDKLVAEQIDATGLKVEAAYLGNWNVATDGYDSGSLFSDYKRNGSTYTAWIHTPGYQSDGVALWVYSVQKDGIGKFYVNTDGYVYGADSIKILKNANIGGKVDIGGDANIGGKVDIGGNAYIKGNLDIDGNIEGDIAVDGQLFLYSHLHVGNDEKKQIRNIYVNGGVFAGQSITSGADIEADGNIRAYGDLTTKGSLYLLGAEPASVGAIGVNANGKVINVSSSSERYKENITEDYSEDLNPENLYKIPVKQFNYKDEYKNITFNPNTQIGLIAEDVDRYFPSACCYDEQGQIEGWHDRLVVPAMLKLIQNQKSSIDALCQKYQSVVEELNDIKLKLNS